MTEEKHDYAHSVMGSEWLEVLDQALKTEEHLLKALSGEEEERAVERAPSISWSNIDGRTRSKPSLPSKILVRPASSLGFYKKEHRTSITN
jgi:hypothetical protein